MREPSIADALMSGQTLLDGRYRLDALVRRSATATIHVATHRNGSTAWLKLPVSRNVHAPAEMLAREASVTNSIGSPLVVRDDGTTRDGVPYLVLDPPEAESFAALRARARAGARLPLGYVMTIGDALARVAASLHALGYGLGALEDEDVLVFANGDIALLDLHALSPATPQGIAADVRSLLRVLSALVTDVADTNIPRATRASIDGTLAASYPDVSALSAAWRAAAPEPIALPARMRMGSLADVSETMPAAPASGPGDGGNLRFGASVVPAAPAKDPDGSVIGFLRSAEKLSNAPPPIMVGPRERAPMYDPLSKVPEMPRLVQASLRPAKTEASAASNRTLLIAGAVAGPPLLALIVVAVMFIASSGPATRTEPSAVKKAPAGSAAATIVTAPPPVPKAAIAATVATAPTAAPAPPAPEPSAAPEELQLETVLRTDGAPPDRDVFIDGKVIGKTPLADTTVPCGRHTLQMVAGAPLQSVELPCGGKRVVRYDAKGHWSLKAD